MYHRELFLNRKEDKKADRRLPSISWATECAPRQVEVHHLPALSCQAMNRRTWLPFSWMRSPIGTLETAGRGRCGDLPLCSGA